MIQRRSGVGRRIMEVEANEVCPLPTTEKLSLSALMQNSKMDLTLSNFDWLRTSTQNEQSLSAPLSSQDVVTSPNSYDQSPNPNRISPFSKETWDKLRYLKQLISKLMSMENRKAFFETLDKVKDIEDVFSWFILFVDSLFKGDFGYSADISNSSSSIQDSQPNCSVAKRKRFFQSGNRDVSLPPLAEESFYSSGGESLEMGNLVYAPWDDDYYYPAEIQHSGELSLAKRELCHVTFLGTLLSPEDGDSIVMKRVHYQRIYNVEKLPIGSEVEAIESESNSLLSGKITQVMANHAKLGKHNYCYMVLFDGTDICEAKRREEVRIELPKLKKAVIARGSQASPSPDFNLKFKSLSILEANKIDEFRKEIASSSVFEQCPATPENTRGTMKRIVSETAMSSSTEALLTAKKPSKLFSGVSFMLSGFQNSESREFLYASSPRRLSAMLFDEEEPAGDDEDCEDDNDTDDDPDVEENLKQLIVENGGRVIESVEDLEKKSKSLFPDRIYLLAPKYVPTAKYLAALALDIPCLCGKRYIRECVSSGKRLKPNFYQLPTGWDVRRSEYVENSASGCKSMKSINIFSNRCIFLPVSMSGNLLISVLRLAGAEVLLRERFTRSQINVGNCFAVICEGFEFSQDLKQSFEDNSVPVVTTDYLVQCLAYRSELPLLDFLV